MVTIEMNESVAEKFSEVAKKRGLKISEYWKKLAHEEMLLADLEASRNSGAVKLKSPEDLLNY